MAVFFESAKLAHILGIKMARFTADARLPTVDTPALIVRTRLADYIDTSRNWENPEYWAQGLGFKVARGHIPPHASQNSFPCEIVAARVVTWLKASPNSMLKDTTNTLPSKVANRDVLCILAITQNGGVPFARYGECCMRAEEQTHFCRTGFWITPLRTSMEVPLGLFETGTLTHMTF